MSAMSALTWFVSGLAVFLSLASILDVIREWRARVRPGAGANPTLMNGDY